MMGWTRGLGVKSAMLGGSVVCETSPVWYFTHPGLQSRAHPAVEEISAESGFGAAGTNPGRMVLNGRIPSGFKSFSLMQT